MEKKKEKRYSEMTNDEKIERKKEAAKSAFAGDRVHGETAQIINLMDSVDKLKVSVEKGTESSSKLTEITNVLTKKVKNLTSALLVIGIIALIIGISSVILQYISLNS